MAVEKRFAIPKDLGDCIDLAYKLREERIQIEHKADDVKAKEQKLKEHLITVFGKKKLEGAKGKTATCSLTHRTIARINDFTRFMAWVAKTKSYDMVQRKVNDKAYNSRLAEKESVPGLEPFEFVKLSLTKVGKKK